MSTTDLLKFQKDLEERERALAERAKQQEHQRSLLAMESQQLAKVRAELEAVSKRDEPRGTHTIVRGTVGSISEFSIKEDWSRWFERLVLYFVGNDVPGEKQVALFLTLLGSEGYDLLCNLCTPERPANLTIERLAEIMRNHLQPQPSTISQRYKFKECKQLAGEDIKSYLAKLKKLSTHCHFEEQLENSLRDQFVWGLASERIKKRLLAEQQLTYTKAVEISMSMEMAEREAADMVNPRSSPGNALNVINKQKKAVTCYCCGKKGHVAKECRFKEYSCNSCGKKGHLEAVCKVKASNKGVKVKSRKQSRADGKVKIKNVNATHGLIEGEDDSESLNNLYCNEGNVNNVVGCIEPLRIRLEVGIKPLSFEIDTGSPISAISKKDFDRLKPFGNSEIVETSRTFKTYSGNPIFPLGILKVKVTFQNRSKVLELFVLPGKSAPIIGRNWLKALDIIQFDRTSEKLSVKTVNEGQNEVCKKFESLFSKEIGCYTKKKFKLHLKEGVNPVFCKPRPVPFALRAKVEKEIERLTKEGIIESVEYSDWATPVVPVPKVNGQIRLCGDFKVTLNPHLLVDKHPIPRVSDLLTKLSGGTVFTKLDLAQAYQQVELDEESRSLVTLATHKGLFRSNRLSYGVASAPGLFQREMEKIFHDLDKVAIFFDDLVVTGATREEHDRNLTCVLQRLQDCGLTLSKDKCVFARSNIEFLGFELNAQGIQASSKKVDAIVNMEKPKNLTELKSFLGMINYYSKFIKDYSDLLSPLYKLLRKDQKWSWAKEQDRAFNKAKERLASRELLIHYSSESPLKITCDASPVGLGAVVSHILPDGSDRPIAYASKVLSVAQRNYSQLDREALALVFGVKAFHQYVYGRKFILETDHKPLTYIFGPKKGIPQMAASRVQRWAVILAGYDFTIKFIKGRDNGPADSLSRVSKSDTLSETEFKESQVHSYLKAISEELQSVDSKAVRKGTSKDALLNKVRDFVMYGWPDKVDKSFEPFKSRRLELSVEEGCIMWGYRVIIPQSLRAELLEELHGIHLGIVKMKALARSYFWWPGLDKDIEEVTKSCKGCLESADDPPKSTLHVWKWPQGPNHRIHLDFCGPIGGRMYLVITDAYSKWIDIKEMSDISAESTIRAVKEYTSTWGVPYQIVSDNGPAFASEQFRDFVSRNAIKHSKTVPYHPASNGAAENAVRTFKRKFKLLLKDYSRQDALCKYLFHYRVTPHCTTEMSPAELQINRRLRTRLDIIKPDIRRKIELKQSNQQRCFKGNRMVVFGEKNSVMAKDFRTKSWRQAEIVEQTSPVSYNVRTDDGRIWRRHTDQLRACNLQSPESKESEDSERPSVVVQAKRKNSISPNEGYSYDKSGAQSTYCNGDSEVSEVLNREVYTPGKKASVKSKGIGSPAEELRRSSRVPKPRKILDL